MSKGLFFELFTCLVIIVGAVLTWNAVTEVNDSVLPLGQLGHRAWAVTNANNAAEQAMFSVDTVARQSFWDAVYELNREPFGCNMTSGYPVWMNGDDVCVPSELEVLDFLKERMQVNMDRGFTHSSDVIDEGIPKNNYEFLIEEQPGSFKITGFALSPLSLFVHAPPEKQHIPVYSLMGTRWIFMPNLVVETVPPQVGKYVVSPDFTVVSKFNPYHLKKIRTVLEEITTVCDISNAEECINDAVTLTDMGNLKWRSTNAGDAFLVEVELGILKPPDRRSPPKISFFLIF
jgi:hypothetical protein